MTLATSIHVILRLGLSASTTNDIHQQQEIESIDEWVKFDKDDVISLLRSVRKPGGGVNGDMVGF